MFTILTRIKSLWCFEYFYIPNIVKFCLLTLLMKMISILIFSIIPATLLSQKLIVKSDFTAEELVNSVLVNPSDGHLVIRNPRLAGNKFAAGVFVNKSTPLLTEKGIILSTGNAADAGGPNTKGNSGTELYFDGDDWLSQKVKDKTFDAISLSFEFQSRCDSISFSFFFGSDEYPEYANRGLNDIFGFALYDADGNLVKDLSTVPTNGIEVSVDNINHLKNKQWYLGNYTWDEAKFDSQIPEDVIMLARDFQYDGFTTLFRTGTKLKPYNWYSIRFVIADVGDAIYDSGAFIQAESFKSEGEPKLPDADFWNEKIIELSDDFEVEISDGKLLRVFSHIQFEFDSDSLIHSTDDEISKLVDYLNANPFMSCEVVGYTDAVGTETYNLDLSTRRAKNVYMELIHAHISPKRISYVGKGEIGSHNKFETEQGIDKDRRVEFVLFVEK